MLFAKLILFSISNTLDMMPSGYVSYIALCESTVATEHVECWKFVRRLLIRFNDGTIQKDFKEAHMEKPMRR